MDIKSAFLDGYIKEEVYVEQPPGFEDHKHHDHVFKLIKALYGLLQPVKSFGEFEHMVRMLVVFKSRWLLHIDFFFDKIVQEGTLDIHLKQLNRL